MNEAVAYFFKRLLGCVQKGVPGTYTVLIFLKSYMKLSILEFWKG